MPYFSWPHIPKSDPANTLRIMLVADPQLPGYWNQPSSIFGSISRHDSDSYLARTYSQDRGGTDRIHDQSVCEIENCNLDETVRGSLKRPFII